MPVPVYAWAMKRVAGPVREGKLGLWSPGGRVRPRACRPIRIDPPGVIVRSGAPQSKRRSPLWVAAGRLLHLIPSLADRRGRSLRVPGSPLRLPSGPVPGGSRDRRVPVLPDYRSGLGPRRLPRLAGAAGHRGHHPGPVPAHEPPGTVPSAPRRGTGPRRDQGGRRVAPRYAPYAPRCLGFLYLAAAWIGLKSHLNTTWTGHAVPRRPTRACGRPL